MLASLDCSVGDFGNTYPIFEVDVPEGSFGGQSVKYTIELEGSQKITASNVDKLYRLMQTQGAFQKFQEERFHFFQGAASGVGYSIWNTFLFFTVGLMLFPLTIIKQIARRENLYSAQNATVENLQTRMITEGLTISRNGTPISSREELLDASHAIASVDSKYTNLLRA